MKKAYSSTHENGLLSDYVARSLFAVLIVESGPCEVTTQVDFTNIEQTVGQGSITISYDETGNDVHRNNRSKEENNHYDDGNSHQRNSCCSSHASDGGLWERIRLLPRTAIAVLVGLKAREFVSALRLMLPQVEGCTVGGAMFHQGPWRMPVRRPAALDVPNILLSADKFLALWADRHSW